MDYGGRSLACMASFICARWNHKGQEAEYAKLKGEYDAIHQTALMKKCPGMIAPQPSTTITDSRDDKSDKNIKQEARK